MALIIDATIGADTSNSYVTEAEALAYFESRPNNTWAALAEEVKKACLIHAGRLNDRLVSYSGSIVNTDPRQARSFPRSGVYDTEGIIIASTVIPQGIQDAQCEQALYLSIVDADKTTNAKYLEAKVGKGAVAVKFNTIYSVQKLSQSAIDLLGDFGIVDGGVTANGLRNLQTERV